MLGSPAEPGLIPRCANTYSTPYKKIIGEQRNVKNHQGICNDKINVRVSYLEIYQENVLDLLDIESGKKDIREDTKKKCVYVDGLVEKSSFPQGSCRMDGMYDQHAPRLVSSLALA